MNERAVALVGDPVVHSLSPAMHEAAFRHVGLPWRYVVERMGRDELPARWAELRRRYVGLNVTIPLKEAVLPLLDDVHGVARAAGSVNTVAFRPDGAAEGFSTDGVGFLAALDRSVQRTLRRAVVLGSGGAARAVTAALLARGVNVGVWARNRAAAERLAQSLRADDAAVLALADAAAPGDSIADADLVVNATPVGSEAAPGNPLPEDAPLRRDAVVFDLVYRPVRTPLLIAADRHGCVTVPGVEMLIEQGVRSFEIWTGLDAPVEVMRAAAWNAVAVPPEQTEVLT